MADKFFRNLTIGTRFNKDQIQTLKLNDLQKKAQLPEPSSKVDFFAENTQTPLGSEISVKKVLLKTKLAKTKTFKSIEDVNIFRKKQKIKVYGSDVPAPILTFEGMLRLGVPEGVAVLLKSVGFKKPTPVQQQAAPILAEVKPYLAESHFIYLLLESRCFYCGSDWFRKDCGLFAGYRRKTLKVPF